MEILQNHYMSRPRHHTATEYEEKTCYLLLDDTELLHYKASNYQSIKLATYKQGLARVHKHLDLFKTLLSAMDYYIAFVSSTMGGTMATLPLKDRLHVLATNIYHHILIERGSPLQML